MVILKLIGGLGNQLFQYAIGRSLAHRLQTALKFDISGYEKDQLGRAYRLNVFSIDAEVATNEEIKRLRGSPQIGFVSRVTRLFGLSSLPRSYIAEQGTAFDPTIATLPDNVYLEGYWQSEKYFKDSEPQIRRELTLKNPISPQTEQVAKRITGSTNSISLHIRRADYVSNAITRSIYSELTVAYYQKAAALLAERVGSPTIFIFSDDLEWAKANLKLPYRMVFVGHNGKERDYEDLYLMSLCQHHIIANSSFSWWGAWLGTASDKIVIAPREWFRGKDETGGDRYPKTWITM